MNFWVSQLTSGKFNINNIAIAILDGAQGTDKTTVTAKIAAADLLTSHLDLSIEQNAYSSASSITLAKNYIATIGSSHAGTGAEVDAVILQMLNSAGQAPGSDGSDNGSSDGNPPAPTLTAVIDNGVLKFGGSAFNGANAVAVHISGDGHLVFSQNGASAILADGIFSSVKDDVKIASEVVDGSQVLAHTAGHGWEFVGTGAIDAADFYGALGSHDSLVLLSGFNVNDAVPQDGDWGDVPGQIVSFLSSLNSVGKALSALETGAEFLSSNVDATIVATAGAKTLLNDAIVSLLHDLKAPVSAEDLPDIGLPILLNGTANTTHVTSDTGFTLVGNWEEIRNDISHFSFPISGGSSDTLQGGKGNDILIGLGDDGAYTYKTDKAIKVVTEGDHLTGGGGDDIFVYLNIKNFYSDGVDTIKDFNVGDKLVVISDNMLGVSMVDADGDGQQNDALVSFFGNSGGDPVDFHSGVILLNTGELDTNTQSIGTVGITTLSVHVDSLPA